MEKLLVKNVPLQSTGDHGASFSLSSGSAPSPSSPRFVNVPRWLDPVELKGGYTSCVKMSCERAYTSAGVPPVTHLILDYAHLIYSHRHADFYPCKHRDMENLSSAGEEGESDGGRGGRGRGRGRGGTRAGDSLPRPAIWLYVYFTHPEGGAALHRDICAPRLSQKFHPDTISLISGIFPLGKAEKIKKQQERNPRFRNPVRHGHQRGGNHSLPLEEKREDSDVVLPDEAFHSSLVGPYNAAYKVLTSDPDIILLSPNKEGPSQVEGGRGGEEGGAADRQPCTCPSAAATPTTPLFDANQQNSEATTFGMITVNALDPVAASCRRVLEGLDALIRARRGGLQPPHGENPPLPPSTSPASCKYHGSGGVLRSLQPYRKLSSQALSEIRSQWEEQRSNNKTDGGEEKPQHLDENHDVDDGNNSTTTDIPVSPKSCPSKNTRSASVDGQALMSESYNYYRKDVLHLNWSSSFLYASVSILQGNEQPHKCMDKFVPYAVAKSLQLYEYNRGSNKKTAQQDGSKYIGLFDIPYLFLLRWVPSRFLSSKSIQKEFHVTLSFLGDGVDPFFVVALGQEVECQKRANEKRDGKKQVGLPPQDTVKEEKKKSTASITTAINSALITASDDQEEGTTGETEEKKKEKAEKEIPTSTTTNSVVSSSCSDEATLSSSFSISHFRYPHPPYYPDCLYDVVVKAVVSDRYATAMVVDMEATTPFPPCANMIPHITIATASGVTPAYSNIMLQEALLGKRFPPSVYPFSLPPAQREVFWLDREVIEVIPTNFSFVPGEKPNRCHHIHNTHNDHHAQEDPNKEKGEEERKKKEEDEGRNEEIHSTLGTEAALVNSKFPIFRGVLAIHRKR